MVKSHAVYSVEFVINWSCGRLIHLTRVKWSSLFQNLKWYGAYPKSTNHAFHLIGLANDHNSSRLDIDLEFLHGGLVIQDNIASFKDCERMRILAMQTYEPNTNSSMRGVCTQISKIFVLPDLAQAPTIKFTPPQITVLPAPVVVAPSNITIHKD